VDSRCFNSVCPFGGGGVRDAFSKLLQAIPKSDLSTYVLCLMMYLMSYDLYHMSYLMSYIIWSHGFGLCLVFRTYDLMTRVDALYLPSTGHLLRILIPLEEPPHLTADLIHLLVRLPSELWATAFPTSLLFSNCMVLPSNIGDDR
jgi:hypothetical protein